MINKERCETCEWRASEIGYPSKCPTHATPQAESWEKEFEYMERNHGWIPEHKKAVKSFIQKTLDEQKKKIMNSPCNCESCTIEYQNNIRQDERNRLIALLPEERYDELKGLGNYQEGWNHHRHAFLKNLEK